MSFDPSKYINLTKGLTTDIIKNQPPSKPVLLNENQMQELQKSLGETSTTETTVKEATEESSTTTVPPLTPPQPRPQRLRPQRFQDHHVLRTDGFV